MKKLFVITILALLSFNAFCKKDLKTDSVFISAYGDTCENAILIIDQQRGIDKNPNKQSMKFVVMIYRSLEARNDGYMPYFEKVYEIDKSEFQSIFSSGMNSTYSQVYEGLEGYVLTLIGDPEYYIYQKFE